MEAGVPNEFELLLHPQGKQVQENVITTLALPSYAEMMTKRELTSSVEQLSVFINQGHTEAARVTKFAELRNPVNRSP